VIINSSLKSSSEDEEPVKDTKVRMERALKSGLICNSLPEEASGYAARLVSE
jgi:hypothetical protein